MGKGANHDFCNVLKESKASKPPLETNEANFLGILVAVNVSLFSLAKSTNGA